MNLQRIGGIILLAAGVTLLVIAVNASNAPADRWSNFFTGHLTDSTMWYFVVGIVSVLAGLTLEFVSLRNRHD